jgi:hypothetical protein
MIVVVVETKGRREREKGREGKRREEKGREGKRREEKERKGKRRVEKGRDGKRRGREGKRREGKEGHVMKKRHLSLSLSLSSLSSASTAHCALRRQCDASQSRHAWLFSRSVGRETREIRGEGTQD